VTREIAEKVGREGKLSLIATAIPSHPSPSGAVQKQDSNARASPPLLSQGATTCHAASAGKGLADYEYKYICPHRASKRIKQVLANSHNKAERLEKLRELRPFTVSRVVESPSQKISLSFFPKLCLLACYPDST